MMVTQITKCDISMSHVTQSYDTEKVIEGSRIGDVI